MAVSYLKNLQNFMCVWLAFLCVWLAYQINITWLEHLRKFLIHRFGALLKHTKWNWIRFLTDNLVFMKCIRSGRQRNRRKLKISFIFNKFTKSLNGDIWRIRLSCNQVSNSLLIANCDLCHNYEVFNGHCTQILIVFKIIYFTKMTMRNSFLVHCVLRCSKMVLEFYSFKNIFIIIVENQ